MTPLSPRGFSMAGKIELTLYELKSVCHLIDTINDDNYVAVLIIQRLYGYDFIVIDRFENSVKVSVAQNTKELLEILNNTKCPQCGLFHYGYVYFAIYDDDNVRIIKMSPYEATNPVKLNQILEQLVQ